MTPEEICTRLKSAFDTQILEFRGDLLDPYVRVASSAICRISAFLRDEEDLLFDTVMCLSGVDYPPEHLTVVYHLYSIIRRHRIVLKTDLPRDCPRLSSVEGVWPAASWHEREAYDLLGIVFEGHSDLRRILLPDDWEGHPLRKDYSVPEFYNGMKIEV